MPYLKKTYFAGKTIEMQNHVLPYLQSFCSLEEKSVQEKQERQVAEKQDSRVEASRAANVTKGDNDKAVKKVVSSMQTEKNKATTKAKKPSIHERLEINKRKIQEKQGKDELERGRLKKCIHSDGLLFFTILCRKVSNILHVMV